MIKRNLNSTFRTNITPNFPNPLLSPKNPLFPPSTNILSTNRTRHRIEIALRPLCNNVFIRCVPTNTSEIATQDEEIFPSQTGDKDYICRDAFSAEKTTDTRGD
jgi:hypothetical protein